MFELLFWLGFLAALIYIPVWGVKGYAKAQHQKALRHDAKVVRVQRKAEDDLLKRLRKQFNRKHPNASEVQFEAWLQNKGYL